MTKHILQGKKDAIKANLVAIYSFVKEYGEDEMYHTNKITGDTFIEKGELLEDGRVSVEIKKV